MEEEDSPRDLMVDAINHIDMEHLTFDQIRGLKTMLRVAVEGLGDEIADENHNQGEIAYEALKNIANMLEAAGFCARIQM